MSFQANTAHNSGTSQIILLGRKKRRVTQNIRTLLIMSGLCLFSLFPSTPFEQNIRLQIRIKKKLCTSLCCLNIFRLIDGGPASSLETRILSRRLSPSYDDLPVVPERRVDRLAFLSVDEHGDVGILTLSEPEDHLGPVDTN